MSTYKIPLHERNGIVRVDLPQYRTGQAVREDIVETFGFEVFDISTSIPKKDQQEYLNLTYDSLNDISTITGLKKKQITWDGRLSLFLGMGALDRNRKYRTLGQYCSQIESIVIRHLPTGVLGHEWFHFIEDMIKKENLEIPEYKILQEMFTGDCEFRENAVMLDKMVSETHTGSNLAQSFYFQSPNEMFARAGEAYLFLKMLKAGGINRFLVESAMDPELYPFTELATVVDLMDGMFKRIVNT